MYRGIVYITAQYHANELISLRKENRQMKVEISNLLTSRVAPLPQLPLSASLLSTMPSSSIRYSMSRLQPSVPTHVPRLHTPSNVVFDSKPQQLLFLRPSTNFTVHRPNTDASWECTKTIASTHARSTTSSRQGVRK